MKLKLLKLSSIPIFSTPTLLISSCNNAKKVNSNSDVQNIDNEFWHSKSMIKALSTKIDGLPQVNNNFIRGVSLYEIASEFLLTDLDLKEFIKKITNNEEGITTLFGILQQQYNIIKGRNIIGMLKIGGNVFHGLSKVMFLLDGNRINSISKENSWDATNMLSSIYGNDLNSSDIPFEFEETQNDIGGYISFTLDTNNSKLLNISTGVLSNDRQWWKESNEIWLLKLGSTHPNINTDHLFKSNLNNDIHGNVAWSNGVGHNLVNQQLLGLSIPTSEYEKYFSTQHDGLWVKLV